MKCRANFSLAVNGLRGTRHYTSDIFVASSWPRSSFLSWLLSALPLAASSAVFGLEHTVDLGPASSSTLRPAMANIQDRLRNVIEIERFQKGSTYRHTNHARAGFFQNINDKLKHYQNLLFPINRATATTRNI